MRRGHISTAQEKALEELLPLYEIPYDANQMFDAVKTFENNNPLVLEIGCGMGETTAAIAQAHPEINFIGCEVFAAGVGALSKRLHDMNPVSYTHLDVYKRQGEEQRKYYYV